LKGATPKALLADILENTTAPGNVQCFFINAGKNYDPPGCLHSGAFFSKLSGA
jgi:hypothetical protein